MPFGVIELGLVVHEKNTDVNSTNVWQLGNENMEVINLLQFRRVIIGSEQNIAK